MSREARRRWRRSRPPGPAAVGPGDRSGAVDVRIPAETLARLDDASRIRLGFPLDFYPWAGDGGATLPRLDPRVRPAARRLLGLPT